MSGLTLMQIRLIKRSMLRAFVFGKTDYNGCLREEIEELLNALNESLGSKPDTRESET